MIYDVTFEKDAVYDSPLGCRERKERRTVVIGVIYIGAIIDVSRGAVIGAVSDRGKMGHLSLSTPSHFYPTDKVVYHKRRHDCCC